MKIIGLFGEKIWYFFKGKTKIWFILGIERT